MNKLDSSIASNFATLANATAATASSGASGRSADTKAETKADINADINRSFRDLFARGIAQQAGNIRSHSQIAAGRIERYGETRSNAATASGRKEQLANNSGKPPQKTAAKPNQSPKPQSQAGHAPQVKNLALAHAEGKSAKAAQGTPASSTEEERERLQAAAGVQMQDLLPTDAASTGAAAAVSTAHDAVAADPSGEPLPADLMPTAKSGSTKAGLSTVHAESAKDKAEALAVAEADNADFFAALSDARSLTAEQIARDIQDKNASGGNMPDGLRAASAKLPPDMVGSNSEGQLARSARLAADAEIAVTDAPTATTTVLQAGAMMANTVASTTPMPAGGAGLYRLAPAVGSSAWDQALGQRVAWMVTGSEQTAQLILNPPELGPLQVVLNISATHASADFSAAQPEVRQALEDAMPRLRDMLAQAGIELGQANVHDGSARPDVAGQRLGDQHSGGRENAQGRNARDAAQPGDPGDSGMAHVRQGSGRLHDGLINTFA